ncbi:MAG: hypothetical protein AB8G86_28480 [Saprospiraceae bacterium]
MKYLYGLSIQGIQSYIFATNKLKEIIGASQLVKDLPRQIIEEILGKDIDDNNILIDAAGNFKYVFDELDDCNLVFKCLPMKFQQLAGDITVSQAVVAATSIGKKEIDNLEDKLKVQRNRPTISIHLGTQAIQKNPKTGKPTVAKDGNDELDFNQKRKRDAFTNGKGIAPFSNRSNLMNNIEKIGAGKESWIGVIHADGNSLGKKVIELARRIETEKLDTTSTFREFSLKLQRATENAVERAFEKVILPKYKEKEIPFRPIIIGGDDVTVITKGALALDFTEFFLRYFEEETKEHLGYLSEFENGLTACAGIAYTKSHYPFHYGVDLAEDLCKQAKKDAKDINIDLPPSCLMFHKVHSSYVRDWKDILTTELDSGGINLACGPYYIDDKLGKPSINSLKKYALLLHEEESPKSSIRRWLSELGKDKIRAKDLMKRTESMTHKKYWDELNLATTLSKDLSTTHLYDALAIEDLNH